MNKDSETVRFLIAFTNQIWTGESQIKKFDFWKALQCVYCWFSCWIECISAFHVWNFIFHPESLCVVSNLYYAGKRRFCAPCRLLNIILYLCAISEAWVSFCCLFLTKTEKTDIQTKKHTLTLSVGLCVCVCLCVTGNGIAKKYHDALGHKADQSSIVDLQEKVNTHTNKHTSIHTYKQQSNRTQHTIKHNNQQNPTLNNTDNTNAAQTHLFVFVFVCDR